jgi:hypothetical protein
MSRALLTAAAAALAAALLLVAPSAGYGAELPPELGALEQQMAQLQVNSERFTFQEELAFGEFSGTGIPFSLLLDGKGEGGDSPLQLTIEAGILGATGVRERVIGDTEWVFQQSAGELDGGRPWVRRKRQEVKAGKGLDPGGILEGDESGEQGTFSKLIEELNGAQTLVDSGPVTVEDERVVEFDASLDPAPLIAQLEAEARAKKPQHPLESLFGELPGGGSNGSSESFPAPTLELEVFIAPNGLPVRTRATFTDAGDIVSIRVDTIAINVPVSVSAPPAHETIGEAKLKKLERRRAARERKRFLQSCKHLSSKFARECKAAAKSKSSEPSPEPSLL